MICNSASAERIACGKVSCAWWNMISFHIRCIYTATQIEGGKKGVHGKKINWVVQQTYNLLCEFNIDKKIWWFNKSLMLFSYQLCYFNIETWLSVYYDCRFAESVKFSAVFLFVCLYIDIEAYIQRLIGWMESEL